MRESKPQGDFMSKYKQFILTLLQLPEWLLPLRLKNYCVGIAEQELSATKQELIKRRWQQVNLESQLSKLKDK